MTLFLWISRIEKNARFLTILNGIGNLAFTSRRFRILSFRKLAGRDSRNLFHQFPLVCFSEARTRLSKTQKR